MTPPRAQTKANGDGVRFLTSLSTTPKQSKTLQFWTVSIFTSSNSVGRNPANKFVSCLSCLSRKGTLKFEEIIRNSIVSVATATPVLTARSQTLSSMDIETPPPYDAESLPSYTIVSGLPSYQDAIEQLKQKQMKYYEPVKVHRPSVMKLFESQDLLGSQPPPATPSTTPHPGKLEEIRYNFVRPCSLQPEQTLPNEPTTSTSAGSSQPTVPPPPPPPYKSQISTISSTSSVGGSVRSSMMVVELPAMQHGVPITLIRAPHKKLDVCHYTIEHERGGRS
uniref:Uncharacterized protein n=1 Tax=Anopheles farauti TaxID=69004 RepID=A0A182QBW3_9DIPT